MTAVAMHGAAGRMGRSVVELDRHYVVRGTSDQRRESVFLGFRLVQGEWILSEVRTAQ